VVGPRQEDLKMHYISRSRWVGIHGQREPAHRRCHVDQSKRRPLARAWKTLAELARRGRVRAKCGLQRPAVCRGSGLRRVDSGGAVRSNRISRPLPPRRPHDPCCSVFCARLGPWPIGHDMGVVLFVCSVGRLSLLLLLVGRRCEGLVGRARGRAKKRLE
jgi:hypothetical protein